MRQAFTRFTAAALLGLSVLAGAGLRAQEQAGEGKFGDLKDVTLRGKLVSLGEEMSRKYGARVIGAGPEKQWGLALPEGELYTFLDNEFYRKLAAAGLANRPVEIRARHFPRSMLLEITGFTPAPPESVSRRFFCRVCNIHFDDWGPCVCCGLEVKVVRP